ncbi:MAG: FAD-binding oxidoreductase [Symploca sp. SIO1C4]|uniref:FAD-binding oxidoreductase n=1 Tax=Symploca sp. SIO1C4 TaxID=2607765 RepID=A0A6B3N5I8_9CYAN|nr:FAD-binding oxidoreductase [Symploca sp. SIO1C4]
MTNKKYMLFFKPLCRKFESWVFKIRLILKGIKGEVVCPGDCKYTKWSRIKNTRFKYKPLCIVKCKTADDVKKVIKLCVLKNKAFRVRSGGHQHEGMCSADNVVVIDLSGMNNINICGHTAWIEPGAALKDVYEKLEKSNYTIPGGGCMTVCIGGLVQGGGWGMQAREGGLTCDVLEEVELVDANSNLLTVNKDHYEDLFWAIKGSGGGNFGVITKYKFKLMDKSTVTLISIRYPMEFESNNQQGLKDDMILKLAYYLENLQCFNNKFTSFARITPYDQWSDLPRPTLWMEFQYLGCKQDAERDLKWFTESLPGLSIIDYRLQVSIYEGFLLLNGVIPERLLSTNDTQEIPNLLSFSLQPLSPIGLQQLTLWNGSTQYIPKTTCGCQGLPHKVSSAFPKENVCIRQMAEVIVNYVFYNKPFSKAATYLSIHSLGGNVREQLSPNSSFFYRDKEFLFQFQTWWEEVEDPNTTCYLNWIKNFREVLKDNNFIEGGFINFVDNSLQLEDYYGENFIKLKNIKYEYDPCNIFNFEMSIPPEPPEPPERKVPWLGEAKEKE